MVIDEYISDPESGSTSVLTFSATTKEDFTDVQSEFEECSYQSDTKSAITNKKLYQCYFNMSDGDNLKMHKPKSRKNCRKLYFCAHCNFNTSRKDNFKRHILTHSGEKPHHCEQCDFKTSQKDYLKRHMLRHSGEKLHHCEQCDFKTSRKDTLNLHMLTHSGEKPHHCKHCNFKTALKRNLTQHMFTHSGETPHHCEQCDFKTSQKGHLKRHMLTHSDENSNHSGVTHSLLKKICSRDSFNEDTKENKKFVFIAESVPEESVVFNSMDLFIKEEPNDSDL